MTMKNEQSPPISPVDEEDMRSRGVHEKYLDAQEAWIRAIIKDACGCMPQDCAAEELHDARRRLMNVIFTGNT